MRTPEELKEELRRCMTLFNQHTPFDNKGLKGAIVGHLNKACGSDGRRHQVIEFLFDKTSSKDLTSPEWQALSWWVASYQIGDTWFAQSNLQYECEAVLNLTNHTTQLPLQKEFYAFD